MMDELENKSDWAPLCPSPVLTTSYVLTQINGNLWLGSGRAIAPSHARLYYFQTIPLTFQPHETGRADASFPVSF